MAKKTQNQQSQLLSDIHHFGVNYDTREIFLGFSNDESDEIDARVSAMFLKNLTFLTSLNQNPILIHLSSPGGCVNNGLSIFDAIKNSEAHITIVGYGLIFSMATVLMQAGDIRLLNQHSSFMVHKVSLGLGEGSLEYIRANLDASKALQDTMLSIYTEKCCAGRFFKERNYSPSKVKSYFTEKMKQAHDWYMNPDEALEFGFIDGIIGSKEYPKIKSYGWTTQNV